MSSNPCSCTASYTTLSGTLTGGIQDIAALLPLLGTEQCEDHVSSALTRGYLYAAASPISLFGSLGLARAGLKAFLASFSIPSWDIAGARTLSNMGFQPQGMNLALIMIDPNDKDERYLVESRLDKLVEELHIEKAKIQDVRHKTIGWNLMLIFLSVVLCSFGLFPYIFLIEKVGTALPHQNRWTFPALRVVGGFLTTTTMQFIIERCITTIAQKWISEHCSSETTVNKSGKSIGDNMDDVEKNPRTLVIDSNSPLTWFLLILLLLGVLASIVGYVGCFSVVQRAKGPIGPLSWLCLEAGLSLLRMFLWGSNPGFHDAPPLQLILARERSPPLPTCKIYDHDIETEKVLPLTRANQFLRSITSFTGVVEHFDHPDVTLYYTLTRDAISHSEHVLYITIFDHKERANTRVYTQRSGANHFYTTESSLPVIDPMQDLLEIKLGDEIDNHDDPITSDCDICRKLNTHYRSIMDQIHFAMGQPEWDPTYTIENKWTMAMVHTTSTPRRRGEDIREPSHMMTLSFRDFQYLHHGRFEKIIQSLCSARGAWIATYLHWGTREMRERFMSQASARMACDVDEAPTGAAVDGKRRTVADEKESWEPPLPLRPARSDHEDIESQVIDQYRRMEMLLVQEMQIWEGQFRNWANNFIARRDVLEKARLTKEWKRSFQTRFDADIRAMEARFNAAEQEIKACLSDELTTKWQSMSDDIRKARETFAETPREILSHLDHLQIAYQKSAEDFETIIGWSQPTPAQREQLRQQSELASRSTIELKEAMLWMDDTHGLIQYRLSRSKWLGVDVPVDIGHVININAPLDVYSRVGLGRG